MAIINNNVQNVKFLRNGNIFTPADNKKAREIALETMNAQLDLLADGTAILGRYQESNGTVKTLVGFAYISGNTKTLTVFDTEGSSADVEELREEINAKLGDGVGTGASETVTAQLTALSGNTASTSTETSVEGAKRYADELINNLEYTGVTTGTSVYVTNVTEADGIVSATTATLPTVSGEVESKKVVMSVSEDKGTISVDKGTIESSDNTVVIGDVETSGEITGVDFKVNIDNETLIADTGTGVISVASAALTQYVGDEDTVQISAVDPSTNTKTISSPLTIQKVTTGLSEEVKEEYRLVGASGTTIGDPVKIYKDSHIVSITYITDTGDTHYQNLEYIYVDDSGNTQTTYVDMSELVLEAEFDSGVTVTNHIVHGVVDPTSEKDSQDTPVDFLTVGGDGFKISGIKAEIDRKLAAIVEDLDATVTGATSGNHVTISIEELDGKLVQSGLTIEENDIASATDLAALSAKTITDVKSANGSVTVTPANAADGTKEIDLATDADKIQMSGFSADSASALSGIAETDSIATAFEKTNNVITENERVIAAALTDLDDRIDTVSGDVDTIKAEYISGVSVNGNAVTAANHVAPISVESATSAMTATSTEAIVVDTDANGNITLGISSIDCGYYS